MWLMLISVILLLCISLACLRWLDYAADKRAITRLQALQPLAPARFDTAMLAGLPEPVRRYFLFSIAPGTPLYTVADIKMSGQFGMGDNTKPNYLPMRARQTLALPAGFVWQMQAGRKLLRLSGSDSERWTRFWLQGLLPVARLGGDENHTRSAFGRYVAEAVFWTPAAVLPGPGLAWTQTGPDSARVTVTHQSPGGVNLQQAVELNLAADGQPLTVSFMRWSNANPQRQFSWQPFGGYLSEFRDFAGFRLPSHVEAGNQFGTEHYFAFFVADISAIKWRHNLPPDR